MAGNLLRSSYFGGPKQLPLVYGRSSHPSRLVTPMIRSSRLVSLAAACALILAAPAPADAQFGGLLKKAKEKVAEKGLEKVAEKAGDQLGPVAPGEQLTDDLLSKVITGAQAADRVLGERDRITTAREAKNKEFSALMDKNQPVHAAYDQANNKIMDCRSASFSSLDDARSEKYEARMKDPALAGKIQLIGMKYAPRMAEAQQKQDPAMLQKVQGEMMKEITGTDPFADVKKDSVATDAKCGKVPTLPTALVQEERMRKELAAQDNELRTLEAKAVNTGAQASGLEQIRYLQLKERALSILNRVNGQSGAKYGDEELAAIKKRQSDLEKVKRAL